MLFKGKKTKKLIAYMLIMLFITGMTVTSFIDSYAKDDNETEEAELITSDTTEVLFEDAVGHWAELYINDAAKKNLFKGDANGLFNPDDNITRAQFVAVLWRMAGSPVANYESAFSDVANQIEEFRLAIAWAQKNGYINGLSHTVFAPDSPLTREAAMKILNLYSGDKSSDFAKFSLIYNKTFQDIKDVSDWAIKPIHWGLYNEIITGMSEAALSPKAMLTRAQLSKILIKYIEIYK